MVTLGAVTYRTGGQITKDQVRPAVIIDEAPVLREGPDPRAMERPAHDLYPGALVLVEDARPGWVELRLAEGETGWIDEGAVAHVALAP